MAIWARPTVLALAIGWASVVCAGPLDKTQAPADARWLVHIDVDAIKTAKVAQTISDLWMKLPSGADHLKHAGNLVGLDVAEDLHGITIFGSQYDEAAAIVVVDARVDRDRLFAFLKTLPGYRTEPYGRHKLVGWTANPGKKDEHTVTGCLHRSERFAFGRDVAALRKTLDVLDGASPGLGDHHPLAPPSNQPGTMIQVRGVDLDEVELPFKSPLVRKSKVFTAALGEYEGKAFAVATAETESTEIAGRLLAVADGLLAMAELQAEDDEQVTKLLEAVEISLNDKTVTIRFRGSPDDVSELIEKAWDKQLRLK